MKHNMYPKTKREWLGAVLWFTGTLVICKTDPIMGIGITLMFLGLTYIKT